MIERLLVTAFFNVKLSAEQPAIIRTTIIRMTKRQPQYIRGHKQIKVNTNETTVLILGPVLCILFPVLDFKTDIPLFD